MIIVKLTGGLGNQMFQYAFSKALEAKFNNVLVDNSSFLKNHVHEYIDLRTIFKGVTFKEASTQQVLEIADISMSFLDRVRRRCFGKRKAHFYETFLSYKESFFDPNKAYLDGYWQSEQYFKNIETEIRKDFEFQCFLSEQNILLADQMANTNSVSIHVRKGGDYNNSLRSTCDDKYYAKAINMLKEEHDNAQFYLFTDNITWCRENLEMSDITYVDWNPSSGPNNYLDMQLMSCCKHNIIANSSYSWWGAWLNNNPQKIVIAPRQWLSKNTFEINDIVPSQWKLI